MKRTIAVILAVVMAVVGLAFVADGALARSLIERGTINVYAAEPSVTIKEGETKTVTVSVYPIYDMQLPGCEMDDCPGKCDEMGEEYGIVCFVDSYSGGPNSGRQLDCSCSGSSFQRYDARITVSSGAPSIADVKNWDVSGDFEGHLALSVKGETAGETVITVRAGNLREWDDGEVSFTVIVEADGADGDDGDGANPGSVTSSGGGSGGGSSDTSKTVANLRVTLVKNGTVSIPAADLKTAQQVEVKGDNVTFILDEEALATIGRSKNLSVTVKQVERSGLAEEVRELLGNRPLLEITLKSGNTIISDLGEGKLILDIPYELAAEEVAAEEVAAEIILYYIDAQGRAEAIAETKYVADSKSLQATVDWLSVYGVGYKQPVPAVVVPVSEQVESEPVEVVFEDVPESHWAFAFIRDLAQRGIVEGKTAANFAPEDTVTRAEFVKMLAGVAKPDLGIYTDSDFTDVPADSWYSLYVAWAGAVGIAQGEEGYFQPEQFISRQDITVMLERYAYQVAEIDLPQTVTALDFQDQAAISDYALNAVQVMQQAGIIAGSDGVFRPLEHTNRAEAAKMLSTFIECL